MAVVSETIIQKIAVEGDSQVNASLDRIGSGGEKAFNNIAAGANKAVKPLQATADQIRRVEAAANQFGGQIRNVFDRGAGAVANFGTSVTRMARQFFILQASATAVVGGLTAIVKGAADAAGAIQETADSLGVSTKFFQQRSAAAAAAGLSEDQFARSLGTLNQQLSAGEKQNRDYEKSQRLLFRQFTLGNIGLQEWNKQSQELRFNNNQVDNTLKRLNITTERFADGGVDLEGTLDNIADRVKELGPGFDVTGLAMELFGSRNRKVVNLLLEGSEGLRKYNKEAQRLGLVVMPEVLAAGDRLSDAFTQLNLVIKRNSITILSPLFAPLTRLIEGFSNAIAANRSAMQQWVEGIASKAIPIIGDILALIQGREEDVQNSWIIETRDAIVEFGKAAGQAFTFLKAIVTGLIATLNVLAEAFNGIFGTNISGATLALIAIFAKMSGLFGVLASVVGVVVKGLVLAVATFGLLKVAILAVVAVLAFQLIKYLLSLDWNKVATEAKAAWDFILATVTQMWQGVKNIFNAGIEFIRTIWNGLVSIVTTVWNAIVAVITAVINAIIAAVKAHIDAVVALWNGAVDLVKQAWNGLFNWFDEKLKGLIDWFKTAVEWAKKLVASRSAADAPAAGAVAAARGGHIRGPGTGTSDSIRAWLSDGEFVVKERAVSKYGVGLLNAINSMRFRVPRFNTGGIVDAISNAVPTLRPMRFAEGGQVSTRQAMRAIALTLPGGGVFDMQADDNTADRLVRYANVSTLRSAGRRPGWNR